ncbi:hypothetical protein PAPHI01_1836 [Pancytospora philotis]|nr:hypothetical protein PAPHI01_1836 [Pancytospora philotis]
MMTSLCILSCLLSVEAGQLSAHNIRGSIDSIKRLVSVTGGAGAGRHAYVNSTADNHPLSSRSDASDICDRLQQDDAELGDLRKLVEAAPGKFSGGVAAAATSFCDNIKSALALLKNHTCIRVEDLRGIIQGGESDDYAEFVADIDRESTILRDMRKTLCEALSTRTAWLVANKDSFSDCTDDEIAQMCQFSYAPGDIEILKYKTYSITKALPNASQTLYNEYRAAGRANEVPAGNMHKKCVPIRTLGKDARLSDIFMLLSAAIFREMVGAAKPVNENSDANSLLAAFRMPEYVQWLRNWHESNSGAGPFYQNMMLTPEEYATITEMIHREGSYSYESSHAVLAAKMLFSHAIFRFCCLRQPVSEQTEAQQTEEAYWKGVRGCIDGLYYAIFTSSYAISSDNLNVMANFFSMLFNVRLDILLFTKGTKGSSSPISAYSSGDTTATVCNTAARYFVLHAEPSTTQDYENYTALRKILISQLAKASDSATANQHHILYLWFMNITSAWSMSEADAAQMVEKYHRKAREPHFTLWRKNEQWGCSTAVALSAHRRF